MNIKHFVARLAELLLESDEGTKDWITVQTLRRTWYGLCGVILAALILRFLQAPFGTILSTSEGATLAYRITNLILLLLLQGFIFLLAFRYYVYILSHKASIRLVNVVNFYVLSCIIFASIYRATYTICITTFAYNNPPTRINPVMNMPDYWGNLRMLGDFLLFSCFQTVNSTYYKIHANSVYVSILTYFQSLFTFALVTLLIASYVNQKTK